MKIKIWKKINQFIGLLPISAVFVLVVFSANIEIKDLDLWLHLAMGKFITLHHSIPKIDILSCTIGGQPWINHEWFFQVIVHNIFTQWGPDGLLKMQIVVVVVTMLILLFLGYNKERQFLIAFLLLLVCLNYQQRFTIRPDIFSLFFFSLYIFILSWHIDKKWVPVALFFVQILWTNMHGFFFFGPLFALIGLTSELIKRHVKLPYEWNTSGRLTDSEYKRLKITCIVVTLACLINPHFVKGAWYPLSTFLSLSGENKIFFQYIDELQKPIIMETLFDIGRYTHYKILIVFSALSFFFNRRRIDISALFFWIIFLIFSLKASRNVVFFAFAAYLIIITNIANISFKDIVPVRFTAKKFQYLTSIMGKLLLMIWILQFCQGITLRGYYDFDKYERKSEFGGISQRSYPTKAADFLVENEIKGNFFNDFNSGAYLIGRTSPNIKVFIDGRTEAYGGEFFNKYRAILDKGDTETFNQLVEKHNLVGAFLNSTKQHIPEAILKYLYESPQWHMVYFNYDAVIFLRDMAENKNLIQKFSIDLTQWKTKKLDLVKLGPTRVVPYQNYYRAFTLESLDLDDQALAEAEAAIQTLPGYDKPYEIVGKIYAKRKKYAKAFPYFRAAAFGSPNNKSARYNFAMCYLDMEEYNGAVKEYETITQLWPKSPKGFFLLAKAYAGDKQYAKVLPTLEQAHQRAPNDAIDILKIGDFLYEQKNYLLAVDIYSLALSVDKEQTKTHHKLGLTYKALGEIDKAHQELQKALMIDPENKEIQKELKSEK